MPITAPDIIRSSTSSESPAHPRNAGLSLSCFLFALTLFLVLLPTSPCLAGDETDELLEAGRATTIDFILERAVSQGLISGGIAVVGNRSGILYTSSRGRLGFSTDSPPPDERTLFDVASLTKVVATAPAIMKLLEDGTISLLDPLSRWFPEFVGTDREDITILNLLTHTSGLHDISLHGSPNPLQTAIHKTGQQKSPRLPGTSFRYADINFILLAELVQRASRLPFDRYCRERLYGPLGMGDTMFLPPRERPDSIASTIGAANEQLIGIVQDDNARVLGGIAGHAGLFSSAADLSRFATMILNQGYLNGTTILSSRALEQMTAPYFYSNGSVVRGLGWDISSPYSAPRGSFFSENSFGHTGYSGTSIWIDPQKEIYVILLTVRINYRDIRHLNRLRSDISTIAASVFSGNRKLSVVREK